MRSVVIVLGSIALSGCSLYKSKSEQAFEHPANKLEPQVITKFVERQVPKAVAGQLMPIENHSDNKKKNTGMILEEGNENSRQRPQNSRFFNSITMYDYMDGALYQVYAAPLKTTSVILEEGETVVGNIITGDSVTWRANVGVTGQGANQRQVVFIKPIMSDRKTNLTIPTNRRMYHLELTSFKNSYMASVRWNYANDIADIKPLDTKANEDIKFDVAAESLNFNYHIKRKRGNPVWTPEMVFNDGSKTYIKLPKVVANYEMPSFFLITKESKSQMVNYRVQGNMIIVDRLFKIAELRLGKKSPEVIRVTQV